MVQLRWVSYLALVSRKATSFFLKIIAFLIVLFTRRSQGNKISVGQCPNTDQIDTNTCGTKETEDDLIDIRTGKKPLYY